MDAHWIRHGKTRILFAQVPLESFADAPDPATEYAAFERWCREQRDRMEEIADGKVGELDHS